MLWLCLVLSCSRSRDEATRLPEDEGHDARADACVGAICQGVCVDLSRSPEHCGACGRACPSGAGCAGSICTTATGWHASARQAIGDAVACVPSRRFAVRCPAEHEVGGTVWGTDVYTDDSSVCQAAVHAGVIATGVGGDVVVEVRPGRREYRGSVRSGVTSNDYGEWRCSFVVVSDRCAAGSTRCGTTCIDLATDLANCGVCGRACGYDETCRAGTCVRGLDADWTTNATRWACLPGKTHVVRCPPIPKSTPYGTVYGSGPYTNDSSICTAALHAGKILASAGGEVTVEMRPGKTAYPSSTAHGITTTPWGAWTCSYSFR